SRSKLATLPAMAAITMGKCSGNIATLALVVRAPACTIKNGGGVDEENSPKDPDCALEYGGERDDVGGVTINRPPRPPTFCCCSAFAARSLSMYRFASSLSFLMTERGTFTSQPLSTRNKVACSI